MHVLIIYRLGRRFIFKMAACLLVIQHGPSGKLPSLWLCRCLFLLYHQPENHEFCWLSDLIEHPDHVSGLGRVLGLFLDKI